MNFNDLTVNFDHIDRDQILSDWTWILGSTKLPIMITAAGDAFVQDTEDNTVHFLDTVLGSLNKVADSFETFQKLLDDKDFVVEYMMVQQVGDLLQRGIKLNKGEVYSFKTPPVVGGEFTFENIEKSDIEIHFSFSGQIHEQVKDIPDGETISGIKIK